MSDKEKKDNNVVVLGDIPQVIAELKTELCNIGVGPDTVRIQIIDAEDYLAENSEAE